MALTGTDRGSGSGTTSATTYVMSPTTNFTAGSFGVLVIAADNAGAGGATTVFPTSITDSKGNVWTLRQQGVNDPGAASAGVDLAIYTAPIMTALLTTDNVTVTWAGAVSVASKAHVFHEVTAATGFTPSYVTGAVSAAFSTGTPTVTTGTIANGDMVIGGGGAESADTWAGDADATSGSWSTHQHAAGGTGTTGMSVTSQRKVVTAAATQTYNPTLTAADNLLAWIELTEIALEDLHHREHGPGFGQFTLAAVDRASRW